ncbi:signal-regulatory protein beta-1-like isoform X2 [Carcharodon carcharias]|uniref:signal-regulatory protein beta-1-like isoform X2 n=1 Tax=Carcharodon carcharias TaxID=13397 RepID=UPI001B7F0296|nr:signal-regulatory protein beta-1-like isoform X2 [Carcharodon carcharias]
MAFSLVLCILNLGFAVSTEMVTVVQSPAFIKVTEGEMAVLHCMHEGISGVSVHKWYRGSKNGTELSNRTTEYRGRVIGPNREQSDGKAGASIQLTNVTLSDAATYYCKVEFITAGEYYGQGTTLIVTARKSNQTQWPANFMDAQTALLVTAALFGLALCSAIITAIFYRIKIKGKRDERQSSTIDIQANEVDNVQYCTLNFNEGKRTFRTSIDKDKVACGFLKDELVFYHPTS